MPRGLSSPIKTELGQTTLALPVYGVRITRKADVLRWSERSLSFDDGTGVKSFEARLAAISGFDFSADETGAITLTLANVDGQITTLDRTESFAGAKCELLAYLPGLDTYFVAWAGWCDDISEITADMATLQAYPSVAMPNVPIPKRSIGLACTHEFGNTTYWVNFKDFEGSECPYQRGGFGSLIGFTANLEGALNATTDPVTFNAVWSATAVANGGKFSKGDVIMIAAEKMLITNSPADPDGANKQSVTCSRGYLGTTKATHADNDGILYANCQYSVAACKRRGMYGNNPNDTYAGGTKKSNYFGGFPFVVGYQYGRYRSKQGERARPLRLTFSGNESAYGRSLPLVYGRVLLRDAVLLLMKPEGDFMTTLWAVCEGVLATNTTDDDQTTPKNAYVQTGNVENIYVNGFSRHDPAFPSDIVNGTQAQAEPGTSFFPAGGGQIDDFIVNNLGFWGTARVAIRINRKSNPVVDLQAGSVTGSFEIRYGRVVRVYSDSSTFIRKATTNPAWVLMDLRASKRAGVGLDYARHNIQSFVDLATYADALIPSTVDGTNVPRWSFNGIIDQKRSLQEWEHLVALGCYTLPPYLDKDGLFKVRPLKAETLSGLPLFSSKVASTTARNILWDGDHSSLTKSRRPITEIPNELQVSFIEKSYDSGFVATLQGNINGTSDPVTFTARWAADALAAGIKFRKSDVIIIDSEHLLITNTPADPDINGDQSLTCQRAYESTSKAAHTTGASVQFTGRGYARVSVVIADRDVQADLGKKIGDGSRRIISKSVDLPGTTTLDEAARIGTLILRAGEFGQGGLSNNLKVIFRAFHRDACDLEIGDIIQVEDDLLTAGEQYFRVIRISAQPVTIPDGGFDFVREIEAVLHSNAIYDDSALTVSEFTHIAAPGPSDPPDTAVPDAPVFGVLRSLAQAHTARYEMTLGVGPPASPANWNFIDLTQIQVATDAGFAALNGGAILDKTFAVEPPVQLEFATNFPGTYYMRARVHNANGFGAYTTINQTTNALDLLTDDTDLMPGVTPVLNVGGALGGNITEVVFDIPTTQAATCWGYTIILHDSSTLPTDTNFDTGTAGAITPGSNVMTDATKAFTASALIGKQLRIFSDKRGGSPSFDGEGAIVDAKITANTATTITFNVPTQNMTRNLTGLKYHICNAGNSWTEKVKYASPATVDEALISGHGASGSRARRQQVPVSFAPAYGWVVFYNTFGMGKVGSSANATILGITTLELLGTAAGNGAVTAAKTNIVNLGDITLALGTVETGLLRTTSSGARVEIDSTNGLRAFDGSNVLKTQIAVSGTVAIIRTTELKGLSSGGINLSHGNSSGLTNLTLSISGSSSGTLGFYDSSGNLIFTMRGAGTILDILSGSTSYLQVDTTNSSTDTAGLLFFNGTLSRVKVDNSDLGSGTKKYLYLA